MVSDMRTQFVPAWKKIDSLCDQQIEACSSQIKFIKIKQTSPIRMKDWTNPQQLFTMIKSTSPAAMTISSCDTINCSCCNYDRQFYSSSSSSTQQQTLS